MQLQHYLKEIGRGKDGARALSREQAADLLGQILDGQANDLQIGAFCVAMRIKGETVPEMAGFLDAIHLRLPQFPVSGSPLIVLPSYNGARRLPVLTPLLALLLARQGLPVLLHGCTTETKRITATQVLEHLGYRAATQPSIPIPGEIVHLHTRTLLPALADLLNVRATIGLRNPAHSLVKLLNPLGRTAGTSLVISSYTHPEYAVSMAATHAETRSHALLLRGMEGEPVADPRRLPSLRGLLHGQNVLELPAQQGSMTESLDLPTGLDASATAVFTREILTGQRPVPTSIAAQIQAIVDLHHRLVFP